MSPGSPAGLQPADAHRTGSAGIAYWTARAEALGPRAVVNLDHPEGDNLDAVTAAHRAILMPALAGLLDGTERVVCDLGCGTGRFTADFAALVGGRAIGVEPVDALRALAPPGDAVSFLGLDDDGRLPLRDGEVDVLVTVTVLGGLRALGELERTATEIRRVVRPGGLVCLAESVSDTGGFDHWQPRTAATYRDAFPWADLREVARFDDAGDAISVLAGRVPVG